MKSQIFELKTQLENLRQSMKPSWLPPFLGAATGSTIGFIGAYFTYRWNRAKEDRRLKIQTAGKISGITDKLSISILDLEVARFHYHYAKTARDFGVDIGLDVKELALLEKEAKEKYFNAKSDFEVALTEYWGYAGNDDQTFLDLIVKFRKCKIRGVEFKPNVKTKDEFLKINMEEELNKAIDFHNTSEESIMVMCNKIGTHLRHVIAPA